MEIKSQVDIRGDDFDASLFCERASRVVPKVTPHAVENHELGQHPPRPSRPHKVRRNLGPIDCLPIIKLVTLSSPLATKVLFLTTAGTSSNVEKVLLNSYTYPNFKWQTFP